MMLQISNKKVATFLVFLSIIIFSNPSENTFSVNIHKVRLSLIYKNVLNLKDVMYISSITKNKNVLVHIFTNRKLTRAARIYIKKILFEKFDIEFLQGSKKFWLKIMPYLEINELKLIVEKIALSNIDYQLFVLEQIISKFCSRLNVEMWQYLFSRYYQYNDFLDAITKCKGHELLPIYNEFFLHNKISLRTYLYLIDEYSFKVIKEYLYKIIPNLSYPSLQLIFSHYPTLINYTTRNLYSKFLRHYISHKQRKYKIIPGKLSWLNYYSLMTEMVENIYYSKDIRKIVKLNTNFFILSLLIKKYPHLLSFVYKENLMKSKYFRYKIFLMFVDMKRLSDFYILRQFYKPYEVYSYLQNAKRYTGNIKYICKKVKLFFPDKHKKLWNKICR